MMPYAAWIALTSAGSAFAQHSARLPGAAGTRTTRPRRETVVAGLHVHGAAEHVETLVLSGVGMSGRSAIDDGFDQREAAGRPARGLHVRTPPDLAHSRGQRSARHPAGLGPCLLNLPVPACWRGHARSTGTCSWPTTPPLTRPPGPDGIRSPPRPPAPSTSPRRPVRTRRQTGSASDR